MFTIARSIFWLGLAYAVIKPGVPLPNTEVLASQAMAAGTQVVAAGISQVPCDSLQCLGGKAIVAAALSPAPAAEASMHDAPVVPAVPVPRPRPDRMG
jgi:hypothetical protein